MIWVRFADNNKALEAVKLGSIEVCGHEMTIRLKSPDWQDILNKELHLCSDKIVPLCGDKELNMRKESARLLSQLSQLSFEELGGKSLYPFLSDHKYISGTFKFVEKHFTNV